MFLSMTLITKCSAENLLDPQELSQQLTNLAIEGLGTDNLQATFDKLQFTERPVDGKSIVPTLASSISQKFTEAFLIAQKLKAAVERFWGTRPLTKPTECCNVKYSGGIEYDSRFRSKVDFKNICVKISASNPSNPTHVADNVVNEMKAIFQDNPTITYQEMVYCSGSNSSSHMKTKGFCFQLPLINIRRGSAKMKVKSSQNCRRVI